MSAIESPHEQKHALAPRSVEGSIYADDHQSLYAAVIEGDEVKEYLLCAELEDADSTHKALPVIKGENPKTNEKLVGSASLNFLRVVGVKVDYEHHWTPACAVFALRRTLPRFIEENGKVVDVQLDEDSVHLGVRPPRGLEED